MQELPFLHSARYLMLIDICMKFREDSLKGFQVTEGTRFVTDRQIAHFLFGPVRFFKVNLSFRAGTCWRSAKNYFSLLPYHLP